MLSTMRGGGSKADQARRLPRWVDPEAADTAASEGKAGGQPASAAASLGLPRNHTTHTPRGSRRADSSRPGSGHTCTTGGQGHCAPQSGTDRSVPSRPQTPPLPPPPRPRLFPSGVHSSALYKTDSRHWCHLVCGFQDPLRDPTHTQQRRKDPGPRSQSQEGPDGSPARSSALGRGALGTAWRPVRFRPLPASQPTG